MAKQQPAETGHVSMGMQPRRRMQRASDTVMGPPGKTLLPSPGPGRPSPVDGYEVQSVHPSSARSYVRLVELGRAIFNNSHPLLFCAHAQRHDDRDWWR